MALCQISIARAPRAARKLGARPIPFISFASRESIRSQGEE